MRIWITIFALALFAGGACLGVALDRSVLAEAHPDRSFDPWSGRHGELSVTRFAAELGLSETQDRDLDLILGETQRDVEAYARAMRAAHDRSRERVTAILSDEQKKRLDDLLSAERKKRSEREIEKSVRLYTSLLGLSDPQAKAVTEAVAESKNKKRDYFVQRKHGGDYGQIRPFFRSVREEQNKRLEPVLTTEQFRRYMEIQELVER